MLEDEASPGPANNVNQEMKFNRTVSENIEANEKKVDKELKEDALVTKIITKYDYDQHPSQEQFFNESIRSIQDSQANSSAFNPKIYLSIQKQQMPVDSDSS